MTSLPEKLSREIERVTVLREQVYQDAATRRKVDPEADIKPFVTSASLATNAIEAGHNAAGSGDPVEIIAAIRHLEGLKGGYVV